MWGLTSRPQGLGRPYHLTSMLLMCQSKTIPNSRTTPYPELFFLKPSTREPFRKQRKASAHLTKFQHSSRPTSIRGAVFQSI